MHVLMTTDTNDDVWRYTLELVRTLGRQGVTITLALLGSPLNIEQRAQASGIRGLTLYEHAGKLEWMAEPWDDVAAAGRWLLELAAQVQPDVVHLNSYAHATLSWNAPVIIVGHRCVLSRRQALKGGDTPPEGNQYQTMVARGLHAADLVVAPTQTLLNALQQQYGALKRTTVIPHGLDAPLFPPGNKDSVVLTVERLDDEALNIASLNAVAPHVRWPIYVIGTAPSEGATQRHVELLGTLPHEELRRWYERAAIFAFPARFAPFSLSALEAALAGCALVLGDIPSLREVWEDAAIYVSPDDPTQIQAALDWLIDDRYVRAAFAGRAYDRACTYTTQRMVNGYLAAYQELLMVNGRSREVNGRNDEFNGWNKKGYSLNLRSRR